MIDGRGGPPILGRPGVRDPNQPTLHTCSDCGFQLLIPAALVQIAAQHHQRGCIGPKLADVRETLSEIARLLRHTAPEERE